MDRLTKVIKILKGGKGSGDFGHKGRPGKRGGSGGGSKKYAFVSKYNKLVEERGLQRPVFDERYEKFDNIKQGVRKSGRCSEGGFGVCYLDAIEANEKDLSLKIAVGWTMDTDDASRIENLDTKQFWDSGSKGFQHAWNIDSNGNVVDNALGTDNDRLYMGKTTNKKFKDDTKLERFTLDFVMSTLPKVDPDKQMEIFNKWLEDKNK